MASFAMVYAGAPFFMWIYAIRAAVFINNIKAKYYRLKDLWAMPYQLVHGEAFADSSIVVPFGCGALIVRDSDDRLKFETKCTLMCITLTNTRCSPMLSSPLAPRGSSTARMQFSYQPCFP